MSPEIEELQSDVVESPKEEESQDSSSLEESLELLKQMEIVALAVGVALGIGCWVYGSQSVALAAISGSAFASINFRLLIWSWTPVFKGKSTAPKARKTALPRLVIKYLFFFSGLVLFISGLKLHAFGFVIGLGNVIASVLIFTPIFMAKKDTPE